MLLAAVLSTGVVVRKGELLQFNFHAAADP